MMNKYLRMAALLSPIVYGMLNEHEFGLYDKRIHNGATCVTHPWYKVDLSKSERRGKTYEELQAMRKQRWEEAQQAIQPDTN